MSRFNVRRLTAAAVVLAALLGLAAPAAAAPLGGSPSPGFEGTGLLDQVLGWIAHLWQGDESPGQAPLEKKASDEECDRSSTADPNG